MGAGSGAGDEVVKYLKWANINGDDILDPVLATLEKPERLEQFNTIINDIELFATQDTTGLDHFPPGFLDASLPQYTVEDFLLISLRFDYLKGATYRGQYKLAGDITWYNWSPDLTFVDAIRGYILWCDFLESWGNYFRVPEAFRVVQVGVASSLKGEPYSVDVNSDGVDDIVQEVTAAPKLKTGNSRNIELKLPTSIVGHIYRLQICLDGNQWINLAGVDPINGDGGQIIVNTDIAELTLQLAKFRFVDFGEVTDSQLVVDFKNHKMTDWKKVRPSTPPGARIGVIKGDTIEFRLREKSGLDLATTSATWSGEKAGTGDTISVTFKLLGNRTQSVQYNNNTSINTTITVKEATGHGEYWWGISNPFVALSAPFLRVEAINYASMNSFVLGGGLTNGRADAARHAYLTGILTIDWDAEHAEGLSTAHEVDNLSSNHAHNETVMDLENNAVGITLVTGSSMTRAQLDTAIRAALNNGELTILDDFDNAEGKGLLKQSNQ